MTTGDAHNRRRITASVGRIVQRYGASLDVDIMGDVAVIVATVGDRVIAYPVSVAESVNLATLAESIARLEDQVANCAFSDLLGNVLGMT